VQNAGRQERSARKEIENPDALNPLADDMMGFVGSGDVADDIGEGADTVEIVGSRLVQLRIALKQNADLALFAHGLLCRGDRWWPAYRDREDDTRKQNGIAHRHDDESV
jgi:hypothetical protein